MSFQQFLLILAARWKVAVATLLTVVAITVAVSYILPPQYTATASVVIDVKSPDPVAGVMLPAIIMPSYMATQVDIINSERVAQTVVKMLKMDENPAAREQWFEATEGKGRVDLWLAEALQKKLDVKPSRESNVIAIAYSAIDPDFAATVANAFAQAYMNTTLALKVEPARQYATWFDSQNKELRENLENAQTKLSAYQQQHGIVATDERLDNETAKLNELSSQLTLVLAQTADAQSKQRSGAASDTLPDVFQNSLIQSLKVDIARQEGKLQELSGNLGRNHPQYKQMEAEIAALKQRLEAETRHIAKGFSTSGNVSKDKESVLRAALDAQKKKVLQLKRERDEVAVLMKDVEAAQKAYDAVSQRLTQTRLESQSNQTNVSMLTAASPPIKPSSPLILLNTLIALFLGTMLGLCAAVLRELSDRRIRSLDDLVALMAVPVLADIGKTRLRRRPVARRSLSPLLSSK
jgi:chain length determinant protein EpsF